MNTSLTRAARPGVVSRNHLDPVCLAFPQIVQERRLELGLSVRALARRCRLSPHGIRRLERAERVPGLDTLARLGAALESSASLLVRRAERRAQQPRA